MSDVYNCLNNCCEIINGTLGTVWPCYTDTQLNGLALITCAESCDDSGNDDFVMMERAVKASSSASSTASSISAAVLASATGAGKSAVLSLVSGTVSVRGSQAASGSHSSAAATSSSAGKKKSAGHRTGINAAAVTLLAIAVAAVVAA